MRVADGKRQRVNFALARAHADPARPIRAHHHFAPPQQMQFVHRDRRGQAIGDTGACAAAIESEHESRAAPACRATPTSTGRSADAVRAGSPAAPRRTETADSTTATRTRTPTSRRLSAGPCSVAVSESDSCSSVSAQSRIAQPLRCTARASAPTRGRCGKASSGHSSECGARCSFTSSMFAWRRFARVGLAVRAALAEQRRARDRVAHLGRRGRRVQLGALHGSDDRRYAGTLATRKCRERLHEAAKRQPRATPRGHGQQRIVAMLRRRQLQADRHPLDASHRQGDGRKAQQRPQRAARRVAGRRETSRRGAGRRRRQHRVEAVEPLR